MKEIVYHNGTVLVDDSDYDRVMDKIWHVSKVYNCHYAIRLEKIDGKYTTLAMHRFILGNVPMGMVVDHINHNGLDNRRENLRICTHKENMRNKTKHRDATGSQYMGVTLHTYAKTFFARIVVDGKSHHLGMFKDEESAANAYNEAAIKFFGEYAALNKTKMLPC